MFIHLEQHEQVEQVSCKLMIYNTIQVAHHVAHPILV